MAIIHKQLFELLKEQQEPFDFDAYLQENGCSSNKRLQRTSSDRSTRKGTAFGFLRSLLTKLVHRKAFGSSASLDHRTSDSARLSILSCFSEAGFSGEHECRCMEMQEGSRQLSPVSVLEFHNHRFKEDNSSTTSSFGSPREAQDVCSFTHCINDSKEAEERRIWESSGSLGHEEAEKVINGKNITWQRLRGEVSSLARLLGSEMSELSKEWSNCGPEVTNLGIEIESAIFEEIIDETVLDMLGFLCK